VRGFTLVEIMITTIILVVVTSMLLPNFRAFSADINLRRSAQEMALVIREAQASAFAVRGFDHDNNPGTPLLFTSWGVYFDIANPNSFIIFVDADGDDTYDQDESVRTITVPSPIKIDRLCKGLETSEPDLCTGDAPSITRLDVTYQRPNPDTTLRANLLPDPGTYTDLQIVLRNPEGQERTVVVWSTGQISIK